MTTVREQLYDADRTLTFWRLKDAFEAGNLIPADEVDARIAEAVAGATEAACAAICKRCAAGNQPFWLHGADAYVHDMALSVKEGMQDCDATAIRRAAALRAEQSADAGGERGGG